MPDDETQHREPTKDVHDQEHDLDAYMRERKPHDPLNLDYMSWVPKCGPLRLGTH